MTFQWIVSCVWCSELICALRPVMPERQSCDHDVYNSEIQLKESVLQCAQKNVPGLEEQKTHMHIHVRTERHTLGRPLYSSFMSVRCVSSENDWSLKEASSNATFTAWADPLPFFIISASAHFPPFYFPVPLHCLFPCMQCYYSLGVYQMLQRVTSSLSS